VPGPGHTLGCLGFTVWIHSFHTFWFVASFFSPWTRDLFAWFCRPRSHCWVSPLCTAHLSHFASLTLPGFSFAACLLWFVGHVFFVWFWCLFYVSTTAWNAFPAPFHLTRTPAVSLRSHCFPLDLYKFRFLHCLDHVTPVSPYLFSGLVASFWLWTYTPHSFAGCLTHQIYRARTPPHVAGPVAWTAVRTFASRCHGCLDTTVHAHAVDCCTLDVRFTCHVLPHGRGSCPLPTTDVLFRYMVHFS